MQGSVLVTTNWGFLLTSCGVFLGQEVKVTSTKLLQNLTEAPSLPCCTVNYRCSHVGPSSEQLRVPRASD